MASHCNTTLEMYSHTWFYPSLPPTQLPKAMADLLLGLEGGAENWDFWVQVYIWLQHYTKHWASSLRAVKEDLRRGPNAFSGELSPFLSQGLVQSPMMVFSVTLLVTYKELTETADNSFTRQMIPSSFNSAHPNYQYFCWKIVLLQLSKVPLHFSVFLLFFFCLLRGGTKVPV